MDGPSIAGRYVPIRLLGEGGFGQVYEAEDAETGDRVALKVLLAERARGRGQLARFEREAQILMTLRSPHVARVLDAGVAPDTGRPFMALELLEGQDLDRLLSIYGVLDPTLALRVAVQACEGLVDAHAAGIVHRDIKPSNIFLAADARGLRHVKLLDFGIAKIDGELIAADGKLTNTGELMGSPRYMSPEQISNPGGVDHRSDLWALGVVLHEMLSGRTPHAEGPSGMMGLLRAIVDRPAPSVQDAAPWVDPQLADIVSRALVRDREKRFASAAEMRDALRRLLPNGARITEKLLAPASDAIRSRRAPRSHPRDVVSFTKTTVASSDTSGAMPFDRMRVASIALAAVAGLSVAFFAFGRAHAPPASAGAAALTAPLASAAPDASGAPLPSSSTPRAPAPSASPARSKPKPRAAPPPRGLGTTDRF